MGTTIMANVKARSLRMTSLLEKKMALLERERNII